jgi:hypothetical protein
MHAPALGLHRLQSDWALVLIHVLARLLIGVIRFCRQPEKRFKELLHLCCRSQDLVC